MKIENARAANTNNGTRQIFTLWFGFGFTVWQWTLFQLIGRNIKCRHSRVSLGKKTFFPPSSLLFYCLVKCCASILPAIAQLVACLFMVLPAHVLSPSRFFQLQCI
jgi:hypothetical protein